MYILLSVVLYIMYLLCMYRVLCVLQYGRTALPSAMILNNKSINQSMKHKSRHMNSLGQLPRCFLCKFLSFSVAQVVLRVQH